MKKRLPILVVVGLGISLLTTRAGTSDIAATMEKNLPGQQFAQTISLITGVAISPLMGVGALAPGNTSTPGRPNRKPDSHGLPTRGFGCPPCCSSLPAL